ncbi:hypothetical protein AB3X52_09600 [Nocardioides sp. DS6]|uniref:Uncharacterized protein n=1 Tax=Nocardioides eburneus TaxID=3231482 RepID=A0ABV3T1V4_9ACTN
MTGPTAGASSSLTSTRGHGWAAHLREGGTTPWAAWTGEAYADGPLPGAEQLELLRRLNETGEVGPDLADRVQTTSAPGRGRRGLPLRGDGPPPAYGVAPVDPADLPAEELMRTAGLLLAEDLVAGLCDPEPRYRWRRRLRTRYRLVGDRWITGPLRDELVRKGRPQGGRGMTVYVVGAPLDELLTHVWTARCFGQGAIAFAPWLARARREDELGPRGDLRRIAGWWADRVGRERVEIVLDPSELPTLLGVGGRMPGPPRLAADAVEVARRVGPLLGLLVEPEEKARLLRRALLPRLRRAAAPGAAGPALAVPADDLDWVTERALTLRDGLLADGYAVHGDPDLLLPRERSGAAPAATPDPGGALALMLRLLVDGPRRSLS